ncbi:P-loop containing nucleoside triphosphate hydrolase protein, partial [Lentinula raphanica]
FHGYVLRRTGCSLDNAGKTLLNLPPYKQIVGILSLTDRENEILNQHAEDAKANVIAGNDTGKFLTQKFYMEYRLNVAFAKTDPAAPNPKFETIEQWEKVKSTKMDTCAKICAHYLYRDDVEDVDFREGKLLTFPPNGGYHPSQGHSRKRKILIYSEFPSVTPILRNLLALYKIPSLSIDGTMSYDKRAQVVAEFYQLKSARVLVFSSVGTTGLNLTIADIVIFLDQPWSAQDERQILGRAYRQPQAKTVKAIHLLAENSSDVLINGMARGKKDMLEAFVNKEQGKGECYNDLPFLFC